ncbi:MAG: AAA family ATPase [Burkholderiaceae bacterium]|nr:AAA family ATPase [Burkholderiaceae bacterium]
MNKPVFTFFNNKGGVGKTTLVYHIAHMFAELGISTLAVDCDPQANLTAAFIDDQNLEALWDDIASPRTIYRAVQPMIRKGDFEPVEVQTINPNLHLIAGDLGLSSFEDHLSEHWSKANDENSDTYSKAFDVLTAFWRCAQQAADACQAKIIIFDIGPNLGAINRSVLLGTDHVIVPLAADLFSLKGLQNLGPSLKDWHQSWAVKRRKPFEDYVLPQGDMHVLGYVAMQHQERLYRPVQAYKKWVERIPADYRRYILNAPQEGVPMIEQDPYALALLRHYKSIVPIGQEARKPIFSLKTADGVSGSQLTTVTQAYKDFKALASNILEKSNLTSLLSQP